VSLKGVKDFKGKKVYLVGGSAGIGLSIAKILADKGAHVFIFARNEERLTHACEALTVRALSKTQQMAWKRMDVSRPDQVALALKESLAEYGPPDILINCAGRAYPRYFEDISFEQFDDTMKTNFYGIWNTVSLLAPHMKATGGYIVNTASIAGLIGVFGYTDYSASKFAIIGFSEALRSELRPHGIGVSVLCPPDTDTPGFAVENSTKPDETKAISEGARLMSSHAVAQALFRGMAKGRFIIIPGASGRLSVLLKRWFPALVNRIMDDAVQKVQKNRAAP
jgi:3-dehydrosphinganine reductase